MAKAEARIKELELKLESLYDVPKIKLPIKTSWKDFEVVDVRGDLEGKEEIVKKIVAKGLSTKTDLREVIEFIVDEVEEKLD